MLELSGINKTFNIGTVNEKKALTDIDLIVEEGDFHHCHRRKRSGEKSTFCSILLQVHFLPSRAR